MIRPARMGDVFRLVELVEYAHARSAYVGRCGVDAVYTRKLLGALIMKHGGVYDGSGFVMVADDGDGIPQAFVAGMLDRVHSFGDMLQANDVALISTAVARKSALLELFRAYVEWGASNPRVLRILASRFDDISGSDRLDGLFKRCGLTRCGAVFSRAVEPVTQG